MQVYIEYEFGWFAETLVILTLLSLKKMIVANICRSTCL